MSCPFRNESSPSHRPVARGASEPPQAPTRGSGEGPSAPSLAIGASSAFVIRLPGPGCGVVACVECGGGFDLQGPTGFRGEAPVCDRCLIDRAPHLGLLLALGSVARLYGEAWPQSLHEELGLQAEWLAFARVYDRFAGRLGPRRPVDMAWWTDCTSPS